MSLKTSVLIVCVALAGVFANAEESVETQPELQSKLSMQATTKRQSVGAKINVSTTYVDLHGTEQAKGDLYSFGRATATYHTFFATYALPASTWNFHLLSQFIQNDVETEIGGVTTRDKTEGLSDTRLFTSKVFVMNSENFAAVEAGVNLPTGSINKNNVNSPQYHYAYNMQLGSGTVDPVAALTLINKQKSLTSLLRTQAIFRSSDNSNGYHLGNDYQTLASTEYQWFKHFAPSLKADYRNKNAISGADHTLPRFNLTEYYYHDQINWDVMLVAKSQWELASSLNLNLEAGRPLLQRMSNSDDVQVAAQFYASAGLEGSF